MAVGKTGGGFISAPGHTLPITPDEDLTDVLPINFPYRGNEQHGVPADRTWIPGDTTGEEKEIGHLPEYEEVPEEVPPLAVRIVDTTLTEYRAWRSATIVADATPRLLLGRNPARTRCLIRNNDAANQVTVGESPNLNTITGWLIPINTMVELFTEEEVYVIATDPTKVVIVHVLQEYAATP